MIGQKIQSNGYKFVISIDDYHPENLKIASMIRHAGFVATFFIETRTKEAQEQIKELYDMGMHIGGHTIHHPQDIKLLPAPEIKGEIEGCKNMIESITRDKCDVFAYPRGRFNEDVIEMVKDAGFKEARTTHVLCLDYVDLYRMPTTVHMNDARKEYKGRPWLDVARDYTVNAVIGKVGTPTYHIWGHTFELIRDHQVDNFKTFLHEMAELAK